MAHNHFPHGDVPHPNDERWSDDNRGRGRLARRLALAALMTGGSFAVASSAQADEAAPDEGPTGHVIHNKTEMVSKDEAPPAEAPPAPSNDAPAPPPQEAPPAPADGGTEVPVSDAAPATEAAPPCRSPRTRP